MGPSGGALTNADWWARVVEARADPIRAAQACRQEHALAQVMGIAD
jgi:hypothetical protein